MVTVASFSHQEEPVAPSRRCLALTLCFVLVRAPIAPAAWLTESLSGLLVLVIAAWALLGLLVGTAVLTGLGSASPR